MYMERTECISGWTNEHSLMCPTHVLGKIEQPLLFSLRENWLRVGAYTSPVLIMYCNN